MEVSPLAGKPVEPSMLVDVPKLITAYYAEKPTRRPRAAGGLRYFGAPGLRVRKLLQRRSHPGHYPGHL